MNEWKCILTFIKANSFTEAAHQTDMVKSVITKRVNQSEEHIELQSEQLVPILPHLKVQSSQLSAYHRRSSFVPMKVRIFVNFLQRKYSDHPSWEKRILENHPNLVLVLRPINHP